MVDAHPSGEGASKAAILVTSMSADDRGADLSRVDARSYHAVRRAFLPLLREIGEVIDIGDAASRLDEEADRARRRGLAPIHVAFRPLQRLDSSSRLPTVAFPLWDLPRIPDEDVGGDPRNNWARVAERLSLILCASDFTRDAFRRAGAQVPAATVRVPIGDEFFGLAAWDRKGAGSIRCDTHWLCAARSPHGSPSLRARARTLHENVLRPLLSSPANRRVDQAVRKVKELFAIGEEGSRRWAPVLDLSGVVYTSFLDPFDPRANWQDLLSAFVLALADEGDATLVLNLVAHPERTAQALAVVERYHASLGIAHRCKVALLTGDLPNTALLELARLSTYYVSAIRAEGCGLAAQEFLAAGRPLIAPVHGALAECLSFDVGFPVESHPEPASWPHDASQRIRTTRHRVVWQSLREQIWASHVAARDASFHTAMAERGRARMRSLAAVEQVRPRLRRALAPLLGENAAAR